MKNEVRVPILNDEYAVIVCWGTAEEIGKVLRRHEYPDAAHLADCISGRGSCYYRDGCRPIVAIHNPPKTPAEYGTLAHEAAHAVSNVMGAIGAKFEDEVFAHSVGAVVRLTLEHIAKSERSK
jgi:hypothetical protein